MSFYTRRIRSSDMSRLRYTIKSAGDEVNASYDAKKLAGDSSEQDAATAAGLTLDDFGGRSDALGG